MKRWLPLLLALALLPAAALAADMDIPQIDPAAAGIAARPIAGADEAIAYAKALWGSDYLLEDTKNLTWAVEENNGVYFVTAGDELNQLAAHFGADGIVAYLHNENSRFSDARITKGAQISDPDAVCAYLLNFVDALSPGAADRLEAFSPNEEVSFWQDRTYATFTGYCFSEDGKEGNTYSLFTVEVSPQVRVVDYAVGIPMSVLDKGVG